MSKPHQSKPSLAVLGATICKGVGLNQIMQLSLQDTNCHHVLCIYKDQLKVRGMLCIRLSGPWGHVQGLLACRAHLGQVCDIGHGSARLLTGLSESKRLRSIGGHDGKHAGPSPTSTSKAVLEAGPTPQAKPSIAAVHAKCMHTNYLVDSIAGDDQVDSNRANVQRRSVKICKFEAINTKRGEARPLHNVAQMSDRRAR